MFAVEDCSDFKKADWRCSVLCRRGKNQWVILDPDTASVTLDTHPHTNGETGVLEEFGMFYRVPLDASVEAYTKEWKKRRKAAGRCAAT